MELSGAVVKQGYLAKQVWLPRSREEMDSSQGVGKAETAGWY